jgi:hypothetical protein
MKRILIALLGLLSVSISNAKEPDKTSSEMEEIERKIETAPPPADTRSIGPWKYTTGRSGVASLLPDISVIGNFVGGWFSDEPTGVEGHDPARSGFTLQQVEVAFQSVVDPYFRADVILDFLEEGVEMEEGYFTTLGLPRGIQVRGGKFLLPFGRQNVKHLEFWDFVDLTLANKYLLGAEGLSELGIELSYLFPTPFFLQFQGTFSNGDNGTSFGGTRAKDFLYQGRLSTSFDLGNDVTMLVGGSGAFGFNDEAAGNDTRMFGGDILIKWKPKAYRSLTWQSEYINRSKELVGGRQTDGGLYSYVDWRFSKRWHAGIRYDQVGLPEGLILREYRVSPAITFDPTEFSRLRLQYNYDKVRTLDPVHAVFVQMQFNVGVHGAHPF